MGSRIVVGVRTSDEFQRLHEHAKDRLFYLNSMTYNHAAGSARAEFANIVFCAKMRFL